MSADLHLHTLHSDGSWTPEQLVEAALQQRLQIIAVTDHDTVDGIEAARQAAAGRLEVIAGIEINTVHRGRDDSERDVHILGYFIDPQNEALQRVMERQQQARLQLVEDTLSACRAAGIALTRQLVQECAGQGSIGRPHLARAIVKAGGAPDTAAAFERFMHRGSKDFIARQSVEPVEAIAAIRAAGGIASIAHPGKSDAMGRLILQLKEAGLEAIEAYHRSHALEVVKHYQRLAAKNGMLLTGGSDCHGPADGYPPSLGAVKVPIEIVRKLKARAKELTFHGA